MLELAPAARTIRRPVGGGLHVLPNERLGPGP